MAFSEHGVWRLYLYPWCVILGMVLLCFALLYSEGYPGSGLFAFVGVQVSLVSESKHQGHY